MYYYFLKHGNLKYNIPYVYAPSYGKFKIWLILGIFIISREKQWIKQKQSTRERIGYHR